MIRTCLRFCTSFTNTVYSDSTVHTDDYHFVHTDTYDFVHSDDFTNLNGSTLPVSLDSDSPLPATHRSLSTRMGTFTTLTAATACTTTGFCLMASNGRLTDELGNRKVSRCAVTTDGLLHDASMTQEQLQQALASTSARHLLVHVHAADAPADAARHVLAFYDTGSDFALVHPDLLRLLGVDRLIKPALTQLSLSTVAGQILLTDMISLRLYNNLDSVTVDTYVCHSLPTGILVVPEQQRLLAGLEPARLSNPFANVARAIAGKEQLSALVRSISTGTAPPDWSPSLIDLDTLRSSAYHDTLTTCGFYEALNDNAAIPPGTAMAKPSVEIRLQSDLSNTPIFGRRPHVKGALLEAHHRAVRDAVDDGIIVPVTDVNECDVYSPMLSVWKSNHVDARNTFNGLFLNSLLDQSCFPDYRIPSIFDSIDALGDCDLLFISDCVGAYCTIPITQQSQRLFGTIDADGNLYRYTRLIFGYRGASGWWLLYFSQILEEIRHLLSPDTILSTVVDDFAIGKRRGAPLDTFVSDVVTVLRQLTKYRVRIHPQKIQAFVDYALYGGYIVGHGVRVMPPKRRRALLAVPMPRTFKELQSFLGAVNFVARDVPDLKKLCKQLADITVSSRTARARLNHTDESRKIFDTVLKLIASSTVSYNFIPGKTLIIASDCSRMGLGGFLAHTDVLPEDIDPFNFGAVNPKIFYTHCRALTSAESRYQVTKFETLGLLELATVAADFARRSRHVVFLTDHKAILTLNERSFFTTADIAMDRYAAILSTYHPSTTFLWIPGHLHQLCDGLSRLSSGTLFQNTTEALARARLFDSESNQHAFSPTVADPTTVPTVTVTTTVSTDASHSQETPPTLSFSMLCASNTSVSMPAIPFGLASYLTEDNEFVDEYVPRIDDTDQVPDTLPPLPSRPAPLDLSHLLDSAQKRDFLSLVHVHFGHPGISSLTRILHHVYLINWSGLRAMCHRIIKSCDECTMVRPAPARQSPVLGNIVLKPGSVVHIDAKKMPLANCDDTPFILTAVDRATRFIWCRAVPRINATASVHFLQQILLDVSPDFIVSDGGAEFVNQKVDMLLDEHHVMHDITFPHHSQSNGAVERAHRAVHDAVVTLALSLAQPWPSVLDQAVFSLNATPRSDIQMSPAEMLTGRPVTPPDHFLPLALRHHLPSPDHFSAVAEHVHDNAQLAALHRARRLIDNHAQRARNAHSRAIEIGDIVTVRLIQGDPLDAEVIRQHGYRASPRMVVLSLHDSAKNAVLRYHHGPIYVRDNTHNDAGAVRVPVSILNLLSDCPSPDAITEPIDFSLYTISEIIRSYKFKGQRFFVFTCGAFNRLHAAVAPESLLSADMRDVFHRALNPSRS